MRRCARWRGACASPSPRPLHRGVPSSPHDLFVLSQTCQDGGTVGNNANPMLQQSCCLGSSGGWTISEQLACECIDRLLLT